MFQKLQDFFEKLYPRKQLGRYVELEQTDGYGEWDFLRWFMFVIESFYLTILPFIAGVMLARTENLIWIVFMIAPIYLKFKVTKSDKGKRRIKVYLK